MYEEFLKAAIEANKEIYYQIEKKHKKKWQKEFDVGAGGDISSGFDLFAEEIFIKYLKDFGKIDSEECGKVGEGDKTIIIDPIDGSSNAKSFFPYYGSSIALKGKHGKTKLSIVCNFANGELLYRIKNEPLMVGNLKNLCFKKEKVIKDSKIGLFEKAYENCEVVRLLNQEMLKFRSPGATALSLAYAHRVKYVLFIGDVREYDIAAGVHLSKDLQVKIAKDYVIIAHSNDMIQLIENIILKSRNRK